MTFHRPKEYLNSHLKNPVFTATVLGVVFSSTVPGFSDTVSDCLELQSLPVNAITLNAVGFTTSVRTTVQTVPLTPPLTVVKLIVAPEPGIVGRPSCWPESALDHRSAKVLGRANSKKHLSACQAFPSGAKAGCPYRFDMLILVCWYADCVAVCPASSLSNHISIELSSIYKVASDFSLR